MKVELKKLQENDLEMVMDWRMRPYITKYMNTDPVLTIDGQKKWFDKVLKNATQKYWIICVDDVPVGMLQLMDIDTVNSRCSWGYYIAEIEYRSLQLAMYLEWNLYNYVFDILKLHKLCNETFVENAQVVKLHLLCGSKQDGIMRDHIYKNGKFYDVSIGSIIADEWYEKRSKIVFDEYVFE